MTVNIFATGVVLGAHIPYFTRKWPVVANVVERRQEGDGGWGTTQCVVDRKTASRPNVSCVPEHVFDARAMEDATTGKDDGKVGTERFTADASTVTHR